jgi:tetratricopeptide (TPR) repeat protein
LADHSDLDGALAESSEAVRLKPDSVTAHYNKGRSLFDRRRNEEARREIETAVRLHARNSTVLAVTENQLDCAARSAELLRHVVILDPKNTAAYYLLRQDLAKLGKDSEAIVQWKKPRSSIRNLPRPLYNLARRLSQIDPAAAKPC